MGFAGRKTVAEAGIADAQVVLHIGEDTEYEPDIVGSGSLAALVVGGTADMHTAVEVDIVEFGMPVEDIAVDYTPNNPVAAVLDIELAVDTEGIDMEQPC